MPPCETFLRRSRAWSPTRIVVPVPLLTILRRSKLTGSRLCPIPTRSLSPWRNPTTPQVSIARHERISRASLTWAFPIGPQDGGDGFRPLVGRHNLTAIADLASRRRPLTGLPGKAIACVTSAGPWYSRLEFYAVDDAFCCHPCINLFVISMHYASKY